MGTRKRRSVQTYSPCKRFEFDTQEVEALFHFLDQSIPYKIPEGDLSLAFLEEAQHRKLHEDFLNDPSPTDVITFNGDPSEGLAGEICVSIDTAYEYSAANQLDFSEELCLYLVHGWLHLAGFDDLNETDRLAMKKEESFCMSELARNQKIPTFTYPKNV